MTNHTLEEIGEQFLAAMPAIQAQHEKAAQKIVYSLVVDRLTPKRPGIFGRIARYFRWSWGWLPIPEQDAQALEKLAREWGIVK